MYYGLRIPNFRFGWYCTVAQSIVNDLAHFGEILKHSMI
jgi:hypothetical protein